MKFNPGDKVLLKEPLKGQKQTTGTVELAIPGSDFYYVAIKYQVWSMHKDSILLKETGGDDKQGNGLEHLQASRIDFNSVPATLTRGNKRFAPESV